MFEKFLPALAKHPEVVMLKASCENDHVTLHGHDGNLICEGRIEELAFAGIDASQAGMQAVIDRDEIMINASLIFTTTVRAIIKGATTKPEMVGINMN